ncbi:MAG: tryptophan synthase subunit beta [Bacteroidia bacterium]|nr:tryptophan synthase subunit beta [Bacteroidia bacterium]
MIRPDKNGYYGKKFGGAFVPEMLYENIRALNEVYEEIISSDAFRREYEFYLKHFAGRPTPLYHARNLSDRYGCTVFLKREDLCHTGAHKINNALGQVLLAKFMGKKKIIAETGAGQHGVATASACAVLKMPCEIFMGQKDMERQQLNVLRMQMLGAKVVPSCSGSMTLKDATNDAIRTWISDPENTHYVIGSVVGPHPYPDLVTQFQSVISKEIKLQLAEMGIDDPTHIVACVGGGSNAIGAFYEYIGKPSVALVAVEAAGKGIRSGQTAASLSVGKPGILHGSLSYLLQDDDGQVIEPHSVSAGLDYPGVGPVHSFLFEEKRCMVLSIEDEEALRAAFMLCRTEGIIPALESAHALAAINKMDFRKGDLVIVNLSGRGDKDMHAYQNYKHLLGYEQTESII